MDKLPGPIAVLGERMSGMEQVTRFECPIADCPWTYDYPGPAADDHDEQVRVEPEDDELLMSAVARTIVQRLGGIIREHLETHSLEEWVREVMRLRDRLRHAEIAKNLAASEPN